MKWFKHDSDANLDAKLQQVLLDYGLEGYGLYWYCLELITRDISSDNITFSLEHDARIIARNTGSTVQKVEEMMRAFVRLGLFEYSNERITCMKLLKRIDSSMTSSPQMRELIAKAKDSHDSVMINPDSVMQEEKRKEEKRKEKIYIGEIPGPSAQPEAVPISKIVEIYHQTLPELPKVQKLTKKREAQIRARWKAGDISNLDEWREYFEFVKQSKFLTGKAQPINGRKAFVADLEWLTNETNFAKVWEQRYHG